MAIIASFGLTRVLHQSEFHTGLDSWSRFLFSDVNWAPPSLSGGEDMSAATPVVSRLSEDLGPIFPPGPMYQAGELSHFETSFEHGDNERETEEQGRLPAPQFYEQEYAGQSFNSQPQQHGNLGESWSPDPYPFPGPYPFSL
ncbi:hypothetical protein EYF80_067418 [Liparis tanakae]|uniref:Uncharacterized protein n=1 Tax=Liparis tanakae TaxID=230148 RepID=A0A4Z2E184_9TELE|nr:hypothetical protein EYF80_067418 [Liparis tanakae]